MRMDRVLDLMCKIKSLVTPERWQEEFKKEVLCLVVLTDYNNRTYRVDDVDFTVNPNSSFQLHDGTSITYAEYYRKVSAFN